MPVVIVVGVQWGDEGKGKLVDYLTQHASAVVRFQGGNNAGHTIVVGTQRLALSLIPSGILRPQTRCLIASGVVVDPNCLLAEIDRLQELGVEVNPQRLGISRNTHLILPYHRAIDAARESQRGSSIGTTGKGIGPAYEDTASRRGIRLVDLFDHKELRLLVSRNVREKNSYLNQVLGVETVFSEEELFESLREVAVRLKPYMVSVSSEVRSNIRERKLLVFEGAQGTLLDINHGSYPFVTSSHTLSSFACVSAGFSLQEVSNIVGVAKAYTTRVGAGPFPTEEDSEIGERLRQLGGEFGTVTGRPRRCGWLDAVLLRECAEINGVNSLILTKLDVLSGFSTLKVATRYRLNGKPINVSEISAAEMAGVVPEYEELPGWTESISGVQSFSELPLAAQNYIRRLEQLVACRIGGFSVGPEREQTVLMDEGLKEIGSVRGRC